MKGKNDMAILKIARMGHPVLHRVAEPVVDPTDPEIARLVADIKARFGYCLLIDCHSMPSNSQLRRPHGRPADFVLGDLHGMSCAPGVTRLVETVLSAQGHCVRRNDPYAGGYITKHYGRPIDDVHVLQIEIARSLYMDETSIERLPGFAAVRDHLTHLVAEVTQKTHDLIG